MNVKKMMVLMLVFLISCTIGVSAQTIDPDQTGSLTVSLQYNDTPISGGTLTLYRVANIVCGEDGYEFTLSDGFENTALSLENLQSSQTVGAFVSYAKNNNFDGLVRKVPQNGVVSYEDLTVGLYLVAQYENPESYLVIEPFFVTVPLEIGDETVYDVDATPKVSIDEDLSPGDRPDDSDNPDDEPDEDVDYPEKPDNPDDSHTPENPDFPGTTTTPNPPDESEKIPQTGQLKWPIPILTLVGLFSIVIGWRLLVGNRKGRDET